MDNGNPQVWGFIPGIIHSGKKAALSGEDQGKILWIVSEPLLAAGKISVLPKPGNLCMLGMKKITTRYPKGAETL